MDFGTSLEDLPEEGSDLDTDRSGHTQPPHVLQQLSEDLHEEPVPEEEEAEEESDDEGDNGGIRAEEPNKFDNLSDGVLNTMALVHEALHEFLEFKDEVVTHALPPNVLLKLSLLSGKVYRSVSDLHIPLNELIRMVRVYATPWEEKSAALKKLHDDYERKQRQLNIAIRKLEMMDAQSKRIAKEQRLLNWERLFTSLTTVKGHGRRWKFMIDTFKKKANLGFEHVKQYCDELSDNENADDEDKIRMRAQANSRHQMPSMDIEDEIRAIEEGGGGDDNKRVHFAEPVAPPKPEMKDKECWTGEKEYDRALNIRIYKPNGLPIHVHNIKCLLDNGITQFKTGILDPPPPELTEEQKKKKQRELDKELKKQRPGRGLIGRKGAATKGRNVKDKPQDELKAPIVSEEFVFQVPDELPRGVKQLQTNFSEKMTIAVHHGPKEEKCAMCLIEVDDVEALDLPVIMKPAPEGAVGEPDAIEDDDPLEGADPLSFPLFAPTAKGKIDESQAPIGSVPLLFYWTKTPRPKYFEKITETDVADDELILDSPIPKTPSIKSVSKSPEPKAKKSPTPEPPNVKTPLPPIETADRASSAIRFPTPEKPISELQVKEPTTPEKDGEKEAEEINKVKEEEIEEDKIERKLKIDIENININDELLVPQSQLDKMVEEYHEHLILMQEEYELRLQEMAEALKQMQKRATDPLVESSVKSSDDVRPIISAGRLKSRSGSSMSPIAPQKPGYAPRIGSKASGEGRTPSEVRPSKHENSGRDVHKEASHTDFFERLRMYTEGSLKHRQELEDERYREVSEDFEKKLRAGHKIREQSEEDIYSTMKDVTLPALFMPQRNSSGVYNPRAHRYFHPSGSIGVRLSQPPSMLQLPPLPQSRVSVLDLFDLSKNFHSQGSDWLMQRFISQQQQHTTLDETEEFNRQKTRTKSQELLVKQVSSPPQKAAV